MNKHTPGPWEHTGAQDGRFKGYIRKVGSPIGEYSVACVTKSRRSEWEANANLIGAAPEMLNALKLNLEALELAEYRMRVNDWAEGSEVETDDEEAVSAYRKSLKEMQVALKRTRAAIAKAEGSAT